MLNVSSFCQGQKNEYEQTFETDHRSLVSLLESNLQNDLPVIVSSRNPISATHEEPIRLNNGGFISTL